MTGKSIIAVLVLGVAAAMGHNTVVIDRREQNSTNSDGDLLTCSVCLGGMLLATAASMATADEEPSKPATASSAEKADERVVLVPNDTGTSFDFDTDRIQGTIRLDGAYHGVTRLVFPRDAHSARRCLDGRWDRNERDTPTVQMCPVRHYSYCLAFLTDPDEQVGVALMAQPGDCYAISTRYYAEDDTDRLTSYSAFDLSLFGDDLLPNVQRSVKVRLAVIPLDDDLSRPLERYRSFITSKSEGFH